MSEPITLTDIWRRPRNNELWSFETYHHLLVNMLLPTMNMGTYPVGFGPGEEFC